jgi:hypothetical protein
MPLQRLQTHQLQWFFEYEKRTYIDGTEDTSARQVFRKNNYGSWSIDSSNNGGYVTFQQNIDASSGIGTASLKVGPRGNPYMGTDLPGVTEWDFPTGLVFGLNEITVNAPVFGIPFPVRINVGTNVVDNHVIENMPRNNIPLYNPLTGAVIKQVPVYGHQVTFRIKN